MACAGPQAEHIAVQVLERSKSSPFHVYGRVAHIDAAALKFFIGPIDVLTLEYDRRFALAPVIHQRLRIKNQPGLRTRWRDFEPGKPVADIALRYDFKANFAFSEILSGALI